MNINNIQAGQLSQNAIRPNEKGDYAVDARSGSSSAQITSETLKPQQVSMQGITTGINYLQEQLNTLLTSFPPFFPAGSPQRLDLIKRIKGLEEQIGQSSASDNLKKTVSDSKLSEQASDQEISGAINRLLGFRDALKQAGPMATEHLKPGLIVNVKV